MTCPDCQAEVKPLGSHGCTALTCSPSGTHYLCGGLKGHGGSHTWQARRPDGTVSTPEAERRRERDGRIQRQKDHEAKQAAARGKR